jgi:lactoylglutathione lyase
MQLGYTILYVDDVRATVAFYEEAFGLQAKFVHESGDFAELATGATALAFSSRRLIEALGKNPEAPDAARPSFEIAFTTDDVQTALDRALAAGAKLQQKPERMPWGQTVAYVLDREGFLVEICTPVG